MKCIEMLGEFSMEILYEYGVESTTNQFSDGQFQLIYILSVSALFFNEKNCVTFLDEPDAFLHPSWQQKFFEQINQVREISTSKNHVLMASHSAITLVEYMNNKVNYFQLKDSYANCFELPKAVAIKKMSADFIKYSEEEQLLSILNRINLECKDILLTEGPTDSKIIQTAWSKLYDDDIPFIPISAFDCAHLF